VLKNNPNTDKERIKPEVLAPVGNFEKLRFAIEYGADAVYLGGERYGLRAKAGNFNNDELSQAVIYAHKRGVRVYVAVNIFAHNFDLFGLEEYFYFLENNGIDAVIISDPGIFSVARKFLRNTEIHISTQANNTNYLSSLFWHGLGAKRIVAARELSAIELAHMKNNFPSELELEVFVHGAMCVGV
jgi:putative protease